MAVGAATTGPTCVLMLVEPARGICALRARDGPTGLDVMMMMTAARSNSNASGDNDEPPPVYSSRAVDELERGILLTRAPPE